MLDDVRFEFQFECVTTDEDYDTLMRELPTGADLELDSGLTGLSLLKVVLGSAVLHKLVDRSFDLLFRHDSIREIKVSSPKLKIELRDVRARDMTLLVNFLKAVSGQSDSGTR